MAKARIRPKKEIPDEQRERLKRIGWQKGQSGNAAGRPPEEAWLKETILKAMPDVIAAMIDTALNGENEASKVKAQEALMSYAMSKATTKHAVDVTVTSFGDFLIQANKRHAEIQAAPGQSPMIEADFIEIDENADADEDA